MRIDEKITSDDLLLRFNRRDELAFSKVYLLVIDEMNHFAQRLFYYSSIDAEDLIQDVMINIWSNRGLKFTTIDHVKNYIYLSIKNKHKDSLKHKVHKDNYSEYIKRMEDFQFSQEVETEVMTILQLADSILPRECAKILKYHIDGYEVKEIADMLNKSQYTVYHQKSDAFQKIKNHISKKKIFTFFFTL